uniref:Endonuclease/exonuclease/phosphatase domain-containing protein n=1 Tax=Hemiselmis andersenii TaxID=464988 RepID=A0A6T8PH94_HEMAN|mmetsp:Transcript_3704/g.8469  ORF Transcript_3704/g.8469 Transcript_3704/m.8469 type:complete len:363 (-) Transcript_3704:133-1221(-)
MSLARVVTYNVLSSSLCSPSFYTDCLPSNLHPPTRLARVKEKLQKEIERGSICCLQEVSMLWCGELHSFFDQQNYSMVHSLYGVAFNGYMGVAIAYPRNKYGLVFADISRISDTIKWPAVQKPNAVLGAVRGALGAAVWPLNSLVKALLGFLRRLGVVGPAKPAPLKCPWDVAQSRTNTMVALSLKPKQSVGSPLGKGGPFLVGTYHMPCVYWDHRVIVIHTSLLIKRLSSLAGNMPCVLAGDFNFLPGTAPYRLATEGGIKASDEAYPPHKDGIDREEVAHVPFAMRSAYADCNGGEPEMTNYAINPRSGLFVGCIDYIFVTPQVKVLGCLELMAKSDFASSLPTEGEPSDHVMIGADLRL